MEGFAEVEAAESLFFNEAEGPKEQTLQQELLVLFTFRLGDPLPSD